MSSENSKQQETETDMLISMLANSEKLKPTNEIIHYGEDIEVADNDNLESCMDDNGDIDKNNTHHEDEIKHNSDAMKHNSDTMKHNSCVIDNNEPPTVAQQPHVAETEKKVEDDDDGYEKATPERKKLLKLRMLRRLAELKNKDKDIRFTQDYNMQSDYKTMKYEWELHRDIRNKHSTISFMTDGCITGIGFLEKMNNKFDYFGLKLDGWSNSVSSKSDQLYDSFGDLYEKWSTPGKSMPPELKLVGILGFSAAKTHWANTVVDDIPKPTEEQKEQIRRQAMGLSMNENKEQLKFTEKLTKQYGDALEQAKDYNTLRYYETQHENDAQQAQQSQQQVQKQIKPPIIPQSLLNMQMERDNLDYQMGGINRHNISPEQFKQFRENEIMAQRAKLEKELLKRRSTHDTDNSDATSMCSYESVTKINPNIDNILEDAKSTISRTRQKRNKKSSDTSIKLNV